MNGKLMKRYEPALYCNSPSDFCAWAKILGLNAASIQCENEYKDGQFLGQLLSFEVYKGLCIGLYDLKTVLNLTLTGHLDNALLCLIPLKGNLYLHLNNKKINVCQEHEGKLIALKKGMVAKIQITSNEEWQGVVLLMSPSFYKENIFENDLKFFDLWMLLKKRCEDASYLSLPCRPKLCALVEGLMHHTYHEDLSSLYMKSQALALLVEVVHSLTQHWNQKSDTQYTKLYRDKISYIQYVLDTHLADPPTLTELTKLSGLNKTTLCSYFKKISGMTIFEYLRENRLKTARDIIMNGNRNISEVAYSVGFSSPENFSTAYRRRFGHPPSVDRPH